AIFDRAGNAPDGGDAHTGALVDLTVGNALHQQRHHAPAVGQGFQLRGRAQVAEEGLHLRGVVDLCKRLGERLQGRFCILAGRGVRALFHCANVIARYYIVNQRSRLTCLRSATVRKYPRPGRRGRPQPPSPASAFRAASSSTPSATSLTAVATSPSMARSRSRNAMCSRRTACAADTAMPGWNASE